jgi:L-lactate permease
VAGLPRQSGGSFAIAQFFSANSPLTAPLLPDFVASIASIICTVAFLKIWHPKESWHFDRTSRRARARPTEVHRRSDFPRLGTVHHPVAVRLRLGYQAGQSGS